MFVKDYRSLSFTKNMSRNTGKNISKNLSGKYNQKLLDHAKHSGPDALKTASKKRFKKQLEQLVI